MRPASTPRMSGTASTNTSSESSRLARLRASRAVRVVLGVAAVLAAVSTILGTQVGFVQICRWTTICSSPHGTVSADITPLSSPQPMTWGQYVAAHPGNASQGGVDATNGALYTVRVHGHGIAGKKATLTWQLIDGNTRAIFRPPAIPRWAPTSERLSFSSDQPSPVDAWVPIPNEGEHLVVSFVLTVKAPGNPSAGPKRTPQVRIAQSP
jgi:hypothetical protein